MERESQGEFSVPGFLNEFFTATTQNAQIVGKFALFDYVFDYDRAARCAATNFAKQIELLPTWQSQRKS